MPRLNRRKSIRTPPRRDQQSPSQRAPRADDGPTEFQLMRKAEAIGGAIMCRVDTRSVDFVGGAEARQAAEFASSSAIAALLHRDRIDLPQYRAGIHYARLHRLLFGRSTPRPSGLTKVLASPLEDRIQQANAAAREERDDDEHAQWLADQRTMYERGEYRLRHIAGETVTARRLIRIVVRMVCIDDMAPAKAGQLWRLRIGLRELADVWECDR